MKLNKFLLVTALSLLAATGLMAKSQSKDEIPGVAAQPTSYFYTGKPYDADLGSFTFNFRNYDPEMHRWTSADPSGFPDGANNWIYAPNVMSALDLQGLEVVNVYITGQFDCTVTVTFATDTRQSFSAQKTYAGIEPSGISYAANSWEGSFPFYSVVRAGYNEVNSLPGLTISGRVPRGAHGYAVQDLVDGPLSCSNISSNQWRVAWNFSYTRAYTTNE